MAPSGSNEKPDAEEKEADDYEAKLEEIKKLPKEKIPAAMEELVLKLAAKKKERDDQLEEKKEELVKTKAEADSSKMSKMRPELLSRQLSRPRHHRGPRAASSSRTASCIPFPERIPHITSPALH